MRNFITASVLVLTMMAPAGPALASGSAGAGHGSLPSTFPSSPRNPEAEAYARGKSMVAKRIACKKCEYVDGVKDTPTAQKVAARVRAGEFKLEPADRQQVLYYLSRRFGG